MAETLTVTVDSGTYTVSVAGVALFAEEALSTPVTFPATVSADTTWYAAAATAKGRRQIGVTVNDSDGTSIQVDVIQSLPATVDLGEGKVDYSGPAPTGGSVPSNLWMISDIVGTIVVTTTAQPFVFGDPPNYGGGDSADQASGAFSYNVDQTGFTTTKTGLVQLYTPISYTWAGATPGTTCVLRVQATLDLPDGGNLTFLANFISYEVDVPLTAPLSGAEAGTALSPAWPPVWLPEGTGIGPVAVKFLGGADAPSGTFTITGNNTALCAVMVTSV